MVSVFQYVKPQDLIILFFPEMTEEWLDFVVDCRSGKEHFYDIVDGPMADDTIWDFIEEFAAGKISRSAFWELAKFKYPTHQITFCTDAALNSLTYISSYAL